MVRNSNDIGSVKSKVLEHGLSASLTVETWDIPNRGSKALHSMKVLLRDHEVENNLCNS